MQDNADLLQDFEDAEDALSLCDLPLHYKDDELINWEDASAADTLTSSEHEHFEFCNDPKVETCPSENIIFCGKLFPSKQPLSHHNHIPKTFQFHPRLQSEQLNFYKLQSSSFGTARGRIISNDRSVVHDKFQGTASSRASPVAPPSSYQPPMKPRWYMGLFGLTRFPQKMEVEDLRIRQDRLSRPALSRGETVSVKSGGGSSGKGSWGLLRAFSCGPSEAAVTASIRCMPHVVKCGSFAARAIPK